MQFNLPEYLLVIGSGKASKAQIEFGKLVQRYAGANMIKGITASGKTQKVSEAVERVLFWGSQGSLWEAYKAASHVVITPEMAPFLTEEIRMEFKNELVRIISTL